MLSSPITVTIDGTAHSLSRINNDNFSSVYLKKWALNELRLTIRHSYQGKVGPLQSERHNVELLHTIWDAEGNTKVYQHYHVLTINRGADVEPLTDLAAGLNAFVTSNVAAIVAWES